MKTTAELIAEAREAASDPDIATDGDWWANNGRRVACELADALERATTPAGDVSVPVAALRSPGASHSAAEDVAANLLVRVAAERDAEKARADAAEVELVTALAKRARAENARAPVEAERNAAVASAAALREALEFYADEAHWNSQSGIGVGRDGEPIQVEEPGEAYRHGPTVAMVALRDTAGAELLAERDQLRKLCADAASVIRILAGVPPAGVAVPPGGSELIARLEAASK